jgi:hypothetical protein
MKTLVLGPEEVRAALDPKNYPKRHVFLVAIDGSIICCDLDDGWLMFQRPENVKNRDWCVAIRGAISSMNHHLLVAKSIHDDVRETTEPDFKIPIVTLEGRCPVCMEPSDPDSKPYCCELHRRKARGY